MGELNRRRESFEIKDSSSNGYLDIKPQENITKQEASDFIAKEFEKAHYEVEFGDYSQLISEIFNRSEDELDIDFEINGETREALEKFRPEKWEALDETERMTAIKELVNVIGGGLQIDKLPDIELMSEGPALGLFDYNVNKIRLNERYFDNPIELVDTIAHEMRHAYQHMRAEIYGTKTDRLYVANFDNYIPIQYDSDGNCVNFSDYSDQLVEVDARVFADIFKRELL